MLFLNKIFLKNAIAEESISGLFKYTSAAWLIRRFELVFLSADKSFHSLIKLFYAILLKFCEF